LDNRLYAPRSFENKLNDRHNSSICWFFEKMENMREDSITKNTYSEYLISLFQDAELKNPEELTKISLQSFKYLAENYLNLDNEMQAFADKIIDSGAELFYTALKEFPDTIEVRKARQLLRTIKDNLASASGLIMALESKCQFDEPIIIETRNIFEKYFQEESWTSNKSVLNEKIF